MKIDKIITCTAEVEFGGITLLSADEYNKLQDNIQKVNVWWWLRSPGGSPDSATGVFPDGFIDCNSIISDYGCVRPALILNTVMDIGSKFKFYNHTWTVISQKYALCDEYFCHMLFRENWRANDANIYESSDIKKYLDNEWEKIKNEN